MLLIVGLTSAKANVAIKTPRILRVKKETATDVEVSIIVFSFFLFLFLECVLTGQILKIMVPKQNKTQHNTTQHNKAKKKKKKEKKYNII